MPDPSIKPFFSPSRIEGLVSRDEFPIFAAHPELTYLDSAATTQKPIEVINAEADFYATSNANVHRGIYRLAESATEQFEAARATVARFVGGKPNEIVFTSGATAAINLVAQSFVRPRLTKQHQIIVTIAEHHSNFVPWQQLANLTGSTLRVISVSSDGQIDLGELETALKQRPTAIVAVADVGNVLGAVNPTAKIIELAHRYHAPVLVDAAQSLAHLPVNVGRLDADFLVGSAHKLYGPTGIGLLWAKHEHLEAMIPTQFGGEMIRSVTVDQTTWNDVPWQFEAGTPNIAGAIGFAAAIKWFARIGPTSQVKRAIDTSEVGPNWDAIASHEERLLTYADEQLRSIPGLTILGPTNPRDRAGLIAFTIDPPSLRSYGRARALHPHDLATILDEHGVAIRAGHHCAQPLHDALGIPASTRASFGVYSSSTDVDRLIQGLRLTQQKLSSV